MHQEQSRASLCVTREDKAVVKSQHRTHYYDCSANGRKGPAAIVKLVSVSQTVKKSQTKGYREMTNKQRRFFAMSGATFFVFCGLLVFIVGRSVYPLSIIAGLGILMIVGGLMAAVFLFLSLPREMWAAVITCTLSISARNVCSCWQAHVLLL